VLAERGLSRRALADGLGIRHTTLRASFLPRGRAPSKANIARIGASFSFPLAPAEVG
jgi:hypothetical protein